LGRFSFVALFVSGCLPSFAASITGAVRDISGSPLAGAAALIRNVDTGYVRTLSTGPHGDYRATALPLGADEVQVDYAAFRPHRVTGVRLSVERDAFLEHSLDPPAYRGAAIQDLSPGAFPTRGYQEMVNRPTLDLRAERLAPYPRQPYVQQWNFNIQQNLGPLGILRLAYAGSHGLHLSVLVEDANLAPSITLPDGRLFFPAGGARQNPNFSVIRDRLFEGHSFYHSLQTSWERRAARNTLFSFAYVLSKSIDDDSSTFAQTESENSIGLPINGNPRFNRGLSNHDVRHHLVTSLSAALPAPAIAPLQPLLSNWRVSSIATAASGAPFTVTLAYDAARTLTLRPDRRGGQRPDLRPGVTGSLVTGNPARWYDVSAFARPEPGFLGNLGRNTLTGPGLFTIDFALTRQFAAFADHRLKLDLRLEAFNLLNRTSFDLPAAERMQVFTRTGIREDAGRITSASPARELQFGLKFTF
jgi:hypothetical protein